MTSKLETIIVSYFTDNINQRLSKKMRVFLIV